jgi:membrane-associated protease RseP (regulator of RpoE activity)
MEPMHTPQRRPVGPGLRLALLILLLVAAQPGRAAPLAAQDASSDCRCVDRDGAAIENCVCFRTPPARALQVFDVRGPRARIGVALEEDPSGARITQVMEASPAAEAGLVAGDVVTHVGGQSLNEPLSEPARERDIVPSDDVAVQRMMAMALDWEPGTPVDLQVLRGDDRVTVRVEPEATGGQGLTLRSFRGDGGPQFRFFGPDGRLEIRGDSLLRSFQFEIDSLRLGAPGVFRADSLARATVFRLTDGCGPARGRLVLLDSDCVDGVQLTELNADLGDYFGSSRGVLVTNVPDDSRLGLRAGDVILAIGLRVVEAPDQVVRILTSYGTEEDVPIRILRRGEELEVTGRRR